MKRIWNSKFDEEGNFWKDERKYLVLEGRSESLEDRSDKHMIIISHTDLDGVTSALNMMHYCELMKTDYSIYMEKTSREDETSNIAKYGVTRVIEEAKANPYLEIEVIITDRMFLNLKTFNYADYPSNVYFTWYDHHSGNVRTEEEIKSVIGQDRLADYSVITDIHHCGATLSFEACCKRLLEHGELPDYQLYDRDLKAWSYNVNLWDTFQWKQLYDENAPEYHKGKKMGTVDKVYDDYVDVFKTLVEFIDSGVSLNSDEVNNWVEDCNNKYQSMLLEAYTKAKESSLGGMVTYYKKPANSADKPSEILFTIALIPTEWKFASNIKELITEEFANIDIVITFHKTGGTVYTGYHVDSVESPEIARFIGNMYGLSGGGHKNAAGFGCRLDNPLEWLSKEENDELGRMCVFLRLCTALDEFIYTRFKEVHIEWKK